MPAAYAARRCARRRSLMRAAFSAIHATARINPMPFSSPRHGEGKRRSPGRYATLSRLSSEVRRTQVEVLRDPKEKRQQQCGTRKRARRREKRRIRCAARRESCLRRSGGCAARRTRVFAHAFDNAMVRRQPRLPDAATFIFSVPPQIRRPPVHVRAQRAEARLKRRMAHYYSCLRL